jgi:hypothetical protein
VTPIIRKTNCTPRTTADGRRSEEPGPFTSEVALTLDGTRHDATATWPDDQIPDNDPCVALEFVPPLIGLGR